LEVLLVKSIKSTYIAVLLLDELEEGGHVRPAEVVDGLQTGEHAAAVQALEVVLANVLKAKETWQVQESNVK